MIFIVLTVIISLFFSLSHMLCTMKYYSVCSALVWFLRFWWDCTVYTTRLLPSHFLTLFYRSLSIHFLCIVCMCLFFSLLFLLLFLSFGESHLYAKYVLHNVSSLCTWPNYISASTIFIRIHTYRVWKGRQESYLYLLLLCFVLLSLVFYFLVLRSAINSIGFCCRER